MSCQQPQQQITAPIGRRPGQFVVLFGSFTALSSKPRLKLDWSARPDKKTIPYSRWHLSKLNSNPNPNQRISQLKADQETCRRKRKEEKDLSHRSLGPICLTGDLICAAPARPGQFHRHRGRMKLARLRNRSGCSIANGSLGFLSLGFREIKINLARRPSAQMNWIALK